MIQIQGIFGVHWAKTSWFTLPTSTSLVLCCYFAGIAQAQALLDMSPCTLDHVRHIQDTAYSCLSWNNDLTNDSHFCSQLFHSISPSNPVTCVQPLQQPKQNSESVCLWFPSLEFLPLHSCVFFCFSVIYWQLHPLHVLCEPQVYFLQAEPAQWAGGNNPCNDPGMSPQQVCVSLCDLPLLCFPHSECFSVPL